MVVTDSCSPSVYGLRQEDSLDYCETDSKLSKRANTQTAPTTTLCRENSVYGGGILFVVIIQTWTAFIYD